MIPAKQDNETLGAYYYRLHYALNIPYADIATALNKEQRNIWWTVNKYIHRNDNPPEIGNATDKLPDPVILDKSEPILIISDNIAVCCDWHIPGHSKDMLLRLCMTAQELNIRDLAVVGDIYDFPSISSHFHNQPEVKAKDVIRIAGDVMRFVFKYFDRVFISNGNHDERLAKLLGEDLELEQLLNMSFGRQWPDCEIVTTDLDYMYLNHNWIIGHPSNYSGQAAKTPAEYADLFQRNVVTGHNHIVGMAQSKSGKYIGIDTGAMLEEKAHYYHKRRMNKFTRWSNGFTVIKNGYATLYTEKFTEW